MAVADAQKGHADAIQQVQDLQEAFDRAVTELDITRSSLARRQQKDAEQHTAQCNTDKEHLQQVLAYPVSLRMADAEMQVSYLNWKSTLQCETAGYVKTQPRPKHCYVFHGHQ